MGLVLCRRSPNLPHTYACSTIGPTRLNFRVRDGNGCDPRSMLTGKLCHDQLLDRGLICQTTRPWADRSQLNRLGARTTCTAHWYFWKTTWLVSRIYNLAAVCTAQSKFYGQAERAISTGKLHALLRFNLQPINQVVFLGPSFPFWVGRSHLRACFPLICIQRLSQPNFATQPCH